MTQTTQRPSDWVLAGNPSGSYLYWLEPNGTRHEPTEAELADWRNQTAEIKRVASARRAAKSRPLEIWEDDGGPASNSPS